jgi:6-phosphofructokinase 2
MSVLVTALNPSIDVEWRVPQVAWEEKNVVELERRWPGGKGVNVARWINFLGGDSRLLIPLGGTTGRELATGLQQEGIRITPIALRDPSRANVIVTTARQGQLRFNPAGPALSIREWKAIVLNVSQRLPQSRLLVLSGSLPRGVPVDAYARLARLARRREVPLLVDCDGESFAASLGARPFLVKPNEHELAQWTGRTLVTEASLIKAARKLSRVTGRWVLVSRGARGALLLNHTLGQCFVASGLRVRVRNTVGAGDAMLAAVAVELERNGQPSDWLRLGIAAASAAVECHAGELPNRRRIVRLASEVNLRECRLP